MTFISLSETDIWTFPEGTRVQVFLTGVLDGYIDHAGQRQIILEFPMGGRLGSGSVLLPPNAEIQKVTGMPPDCTCSRGHKTKMVRYNLPHARSCPLRVEDQ